MDPDSVEQPKEANTRKATVEDTVHESSIFFLIVKHHNILLHLLFFFIVSSSSDSCLFVIMWRNHFKSLKGTEVNSFTYTESSLQCVLVAIKNFNITENYFDVKKSARSLNVSFI